MLAISKNLCTLQFRTQSGMNKELLVKQLLAFFLVPNFGRF
jgi:hypothetical protein